MINEEWITNVLAHRPGLIRAQLEKTRDVMNQRFLDALMQGVEPLIPRLTLPDPNDRHVLAAAIESRADVIVTANLKDFPPTALVPHGIAVADPDDFVDQLFDRNEDEAVAAAARMRPVEGTFDDSDGVYRNDREGRAVTDGGQAAMEHNFSIGHRGASP
jgi:hypothetical protein